MCHPLHRSSGGNREQRSAAGQFLGVAVLGHKAELASLSQPSKVQRGGNNGGRPSLLFTAALKL